MGVLRDRDSFAVRATWKRHRGLAVAGTLLLLEHRAPSGSCCRLLHLLGTAVCVFSGGNLVAGLRGMRESIEGEKGSRQERRGEATAEVPKRRGHGMGSDVKERKEGGRAPGCLGRSIRHCRMSRALHPSRPAAGGTDREVGMGDGKVVRSAGAAREGNKGMPHIREGSACSAPCVGQPPSGLPEQKGGPCRRALWYLCGRGCSRRGCALPLCNGCRELRCRGGRPGALAEEGRPRGVLQEGTECWSWVTLQLLLLFRGRGRSCQGHWCRVELDPGLRVILLLLPHGCGCCCRASVPTLACQKQCFTACKEAAVVGGERGEESKTEGSGR